VVSGKRFGGVLSAMFATGVSGAFTVKAYQTFGQTLGLVEMLTTLDFLIPFALFVASASLAVAAATVHTGRKPPESYIQADKRAHPSSVAEPVGTQNPQNRAHPTVPFGHGYEILPAGCRIAGKVQVSGDGEARDLFIDLVDDCFVWPPQKKRVPTEPQPTQESKLAVRLKQNRREPPGFEPC
jgi:hypothetical protein